MPSYVRAIESGSKKPRTDSEIVAALARAYRTQVPGEPEAPAAQATPDLAVVHLRLERQPLGAFRAQLLEERGHGVRLAGHGGDERRRGSPPAA